jgi:hypothetical protein
MSNPGGNCLNIFASCSSVPSQRYICTFAFVEDFIGLSDVFGV